MCGDLDESHHIDAEVLSRLLAMTRKMGAGAETGDAASEVPDLATASGRSAYMQSLFTAGLKRAAADAEGAEEGQRIDAIASQAIAFARLAGFLAGQLPPEADLFRAVIEALTDGHAEPRRIMEAHRAAHDHQHHHHHHGHDHASAHGHEHSH